LEIEVMREARIKQPERKVVFLTGATGHVGRNLIPVLLKSKDTSLVLLIRGNSDAEVEDRLSELLLSLAGTIDQSQARQRVRALRGDITRDRLGLSESQYGALARNITHIIHSAATVRFRNPLAEAREINVEGTKRVMALARLAWERGRLERVAHISTAFVSGSRNGLIREDDLDCGQGFSNSYEQTKFEAEVFIRKSCPDLPWVIFRPSIIVGDSRTGVTTAFNVLYIPLKYLARGIVRFLPGSPDTPLDIVPVDFVCRAVSQILFGGADCRKRTFHLCAGPEGATTVGKVLELAEDFFRKMRPQVRLPHLRFVSRNWLKLMGFLALFVGKSQKRVLRKLRWFAPHLALVRFFDVSQTQAITGAGAIIAPPFEDYYRPLLEYCLRTNWGEITLESTPGRRVLLLAPQGDSLSL
jgi:thioester reductase-like protein